MFPKDGFLIVRNSFYLKNGHLSFLELFTPYDPNLEIFEIQNFSFSPSKCGVTKCDLTNKVHR